MASINIHVLHTGKVCVAPELPFGGEYCTPVQAAGIFADKSKRIWVPVSVYLIEHPKGRVLVDCGWHRDMSPQGVLDKRAQIKSLGSYILYQTNQGIVPPGQAVDEQLRRMGLADTDLDYVLLTHLDCDHANGLRLVRGAKRILVAGEELACAKKHGLFRYRKAWWEGVPLQPIPWNGTEGPAGHSHDLFGDGTVTLIHIPGHSDGMTAVRIRNAEGKFVLLCADGGYAEKSWQKMIVSGIATDRKQQRESLEWIRAQSQDASCVRLLASHDAGVEPQTITLP